MGDANLKHTDGIVKQRQKETFIVRGNNMAGGAMSVDDLDDRCYEEYDDPRNKKDEQGRKAFLFSNIPETAKRMMKERLGQIPNFMWPMFVKYALAELGQDFKHEVDWIPWFSCWLQANKDCGFVQAKKVQWWKEALFVIHREGKEFCATAQDFTDLQSSPCGFGKTEQEALQNLFDELKKGQ